MTTPTPKTQGFVSKAIFRTLLLTGILCTAIGFVIDIWAADVPHIITITAATLCLYFTVQLLLINRIRLHTNMRLTFLAAMLGVFIEVFLGPSGEVWTAILPLIAFASLGRKEGNLWSIGSFIMLCALLFADSFTANPRFNLTEASNIILSYIIVALVSWFYARHIETTHQLILQHTSDNARLEVAQTLAGGMAHLINNEMQSVIGRASLLKRTLQQPAHIQELECIIQQGFNASRHANQLLAYAEHGSHHTRETDLHPLLQQLSHTWQAALADIGTLHVELPSELPNCHCDAQKILQVLNTLFENAKEASPMPIVIHLKVSIANIAADHILPRGNYIQIDLHDHGQGISPEHLSKIFEPFFSTRFTGRGLGLAAARGIVRQHGGDIRIQSRERQGTLATVLLPCLI